MSGRSFKLKTIEEILGNSPKKLEVGCIELTEDSDAEIISKNKKSMLGMLRTQQEKTSAQEAKIFGMLPRDFQRSSMNPILLAKIK